jgi:hypothetical protein
MGAGQLRRIEQKWQNISRRRDEIPEELGDSFLADPEISRMVLKEPDTWG